MRFVSYEVGGIVGLAVATKDGEYRGRLASEAGFPGSLDEIVRHGDFAGAAKALSSGAPVDLATVTDLRPFSPPV